MTSISDWLPRYRHKYNYLLTTKVKSLCLPMCVSRSDFYASRWIIYKVDPNYNACRRQKSSAKSCIFHKYVCVYELWCRNVTTKSWYQYFLPETTFGDQTLQNLLDTFTVHGPWHGLLVCILIEHTCMNLVKDVEQVILCGVTYVFTGLKLALM